MIKKYTIELAVIFLLILNIFVSSNVDLGIYAAFKNFNSFLNNIYLKKFFINLTELGDSLWYFLISFCGYVLCFLYKKFYKNYKKILVIKANVFFLFLCSSIIISGLLTQILKHLIGRPRPNHSLESEVSSINFLSFDSGFHSFPSGHTSTIFVVALTLSIFTPKIKYLYLFFASIIASSRIVVEAHYFTDVVGGAAVAFIGFKITKSLFKKFKPYDEINNLKKIKAEPLFLSLIIFFILIIFISVGSSLDIYISNLFYYGQQTFFLQSFSILSILARKIFLLALIVYIVLLPIFSLYFPTKKLFFGYVFRFKDVVFILASTFFNLIIVVNLLLKSLWGRARPNDILQLGGKDSFTPWYNLSDACSSNCSFVSGDSSVGFSLIILYFVTKNKNFFWGALLSGSFLGIVRILEGGHFFSDVLISGFLIFILSYLQNYYFKKYA